MRWWRQWWFRELLWICGLAVAAFTSGKVLGVLHGDWAGAWCGFVFSGAASLGRSLERKRIEGERAKG